MYRPHQIEASDQALELIRRNGMVAIFGEPRTGKTRTAIRMVEKLGCTRPLVLTKKNAIGGWMSELKATVPDHRYTVTNYEQITKIDGEFDIVIIDESHNLGTRGKPTNRVKDIRARCYNLPVIFLTGTPTIETPLGIYHQWCVTKFSPFKQFNSFYRFFDRYGLRDPTWIGGRAVESYKKCRPELVPMIEKYAVRISQEEAGIEHRSQDVVHTVKLRESTQNMIKDILETGVHGRLIYDTDMGVRTAVHQIESGAVLYEEELITLPNTEVVDFIHEHFGDWEDVALFCHFRSTRQKLSEHFKQAQIYSSIAHAEGVDMSHMRHMVVINTGYSGAKAAQLRERVVNMNRGSEALVHYITTDGGISKAVYAATSQKVDYNLAQFRRLRA